MKVCADANTCGRYHNLHHVEIRENHPDTILVDEPGVLGNGGNSGFQALNLAVQFGTTRILLIGFDMHTAAGVHWHGRHGNDLINPSDFNFMKWRRILDGVEGVLRGLNVDVINASPESALTAYPKMTIEDAMKRWRL